MIKRALTLVNAMHITASVFINDDESDLHQDYDDWLEELAPHAPISQYQHNRTGEDSADAHLLVSTLNLIQCTLNRHKHDYERV